MPTLHQIFGHAVTDEEQQLIIVRDRKPGQCSFIEAIDETPFIRRCTKSKVHHKKVCENHAED